MAIQNSSNRHGISIREIRSFPHMFVEYNHHKKIMNNVYSIAHEYEQLCQGLRQLVKQSKYKVRAIIDALDIADSTFYDKLNGGNWKPQELKKIAPMLMEATAGGAERKK